MPSDLIHKNTAKKLLIKIHSRTHKQHIKDSLRFFLLRDFSQMSLLFWARLYDLEY